MITLQYFNSDKDKWVEVGKFQNNTSAWVSLGIDNFDYRTIDEEGNVLKDTSGTFTIIP